MITNLVLNKCFRFQGPRVSPTGDHLIWLERDVRKTGIFMGPHTSCYRLMKLDLSVPDSKPVVLIPEVQNAEGKAFKGLFGGLPSRPFSKLGGFVVMDTQCGDRSRVLIVDVKTGEFGFVKEMEDSLLPSVSILDVHENVVLAVGSAPNVPPVLLKAG